MDNKINSKKKMLRNRISQCVEMRKGLLKEKHEFEKELKKLSKR